MPPQLFPQLSAGGPPAAADAGGLPRGPRAADLPVPMTELQEALANERIVARYQPVVRMADRQPIGLEVLARLDHPQRGVLAPDLFIPQLEDAGLAWPLTQAVVRRAFADWGGGRLRALGLSLALNFPLDVLLMPEALSWLDAQCAKAGISPASITIELTESRPVARLDELRAAVTRLRSAGYDLAIDDVGPDVRDHRLLLDLAFSILKLDKDLVRGSATSDTASAFLTQSIAAARAAGLTIIAEGIEDESVWARMAALGIDQAQGYLIARPLTAPDVLTWHAAWCSSNALPGTPADV